MLSIQVAANTGLKKHNVEAVMSLLDEGATVPFIARYRKERTGNLDEVAIIAIRDEYSKATALEKRREAILASMKELEKLTPDLERQIKAAQKLEHLEDIYLPFKPRVETRADKAINMGLEPLAKAIFNTHGFRSQSEAQKYINAEKGVPDTDTALSGASDIISGWINEHTMVRESLRRMYSRQGTLVSKVSRGKKEEAIKYKDYYEWSESLASAPSHRVLAIFRGNAEKMLSCKISIDKEQALKTMSSILSREGKVVSGVAEAAIEDAYTRLLSKTIEREFKKSAKEKADLTAIKLFSKNLRELLLAPPLGAKRVLAVDPGLRTGCKIVCLDEQGALLTNDTIYPLVPHNKTRESGEKISKLCSKYKIEAIAIGNGTGGREALSFAQTLKLPGEPILVMVNESGASVYSASEVAREEFPNHDITVRGSVSIGRRLIDPLAELVKIDPKAIGVGQYQHDVDQKELKNALTDVVTSCVNNVGVDVNTASSQLLSHVSGLTKTIAKNIVTLRNENGFIKTRKAVMKAKGLGKAGFEQCAGFLRINKGTNPLDSTAVHPESYPIVKKMALDLGVKEKELIGNIELQQKIRIEDYVTGETGLPTLKDIMAELAKPGRDPRKEFEPPAFDKDINSIGDLIPGMKLPGVVTNITGFGAFVDLGVHQDGLVHISMMANKFVKDPFEIVSTGQNVTVTVISVDIQRKRIALSMKE